MGGLRHFNLINRYNDFILFFFSTELFYLFSIASKDGNTPKMFIRL